uniref:Uncharacterized protein n=1 Tax=Ditylenchus dipsaci TaxID=166011 RepID=A0A915CNV5_9BILA
MLPFPHQKEENKSSDAIYERTTRPPDIFERVAFKSSRLVKHGKSSTISSFEVQTSSRLVLPGQLVKHTVFEGTKAMNKFTDSVDAKK